MEVGGFTDSIIDRCQSWISWVHCSPFCIGPPEQGCDNRLGEQIPLRLFQSWRLMSELDVSYSVLLGKTRAALYRPLGGWALSSSLRDLMGVLR